MFSRQDVSYSENTDFNLFNFKPLRTTAFGVSQLTCIICVGIGTVTTMIYDSDNSSITANYLILQVAFWLCCFILYLKYTSKHNCLKLGGHFVFYKKLQRIALVLFIVPSFFSSLLLSVIGILSEVYYLNATVRDRNYELLLRDLIFVGILIELLVETSVLLVYIVSVQKFNKLKPVPDVEQYEYLLPCDARSSSEIGYRLEGEAVADLLEKQADLICYFKSTITDLKSKLSELSASHH